MYFRYFVIFHHNALGIKVVNMKLLVVTSREQHSTMLLWMDCNEAQNSWRRNLRAPPSGGERVNGGSLSLRPSGVRSSRGTGSIYRRS